MARVRFLDQVPVGFYDTDNKSGSNPGGPFSSIQYNDGGALNGDINLRWDNNTDTVLLTGSIIATSFTGSLFGTSSWAVSASQARTASYVQTAQTASYVLSASYALSSSQAQTASYVVTAQTASYVLSASYALSSSQAATASYVLNAVSASYVLNAVSASYALSASQAATASYVVTAQTASYVQNAQTASYVLSASYALSSSQAQTASYVNPLNQNVIITGSLNSGLDNITSGLYSHAEGSNTVTYGTASHAEGEFTVTYGTASHAEGAGTTASGSYSHAEGANTITYGEYSHAEGFMTQASGSHSHAEGAGTTAYGEYSHAEGSSTRAYGYSSHTEGAGTYAYGVSAHAEGTSNIANAYSSHVEGQGNTTNGTASHAEGQSTITYGYASHAEGAGTTASGSYSHAEGSSTETYGEASHAEGAGAKTYGTASHAEGAFTEARGAYSHAEGESTVTSGTASHAEGVGTITSASYQHAQGMYNITSSIPGAFILGNGTDNNNRSNLIFAAGNQVQITGSLNTSGSVFFPTLVTSSTPVSNVVMYGTNGQLFITASSAIGGGGGISGDYVTTASFNAYTGSSTSQFAGTASFATTASFVISASYALSSSQAQTASYVVTAQTASYVLSASYALSSSQAQTASAILGGKATHIPYFITDLTLATSSIYQSGSTTIIINQDNATAANPEALYVWQPNSTSINVISGKGNLNNYLQLNIQNTNQGVSASSDIVATSNNGNESTNYIDMGINSENYSQNFIGAANDAYLYSTGNDLHIGNATPNKPLQLFAGGTDVDVHNKLQLNPNNQHTMSGSLDISGSVKASSFTGSLQGNATTSTTSQTSSYSTTLGASLSQPANNQVRLLNSAGGTLSTSTIDNVTSASYANNASTADYATIAGNGGVTQLIAGSGITLVPVGGQGAVTVIASGGGGVTIISGSLITGSFINSKSFTFNHNLSTRTPIITVFDSNYNQIIPQNIELVNTSSAIITFPTLESGFAIGSTGGTTGTALSSSYALFSTYADTASYYAETDPVFVAKSASLATTGSNIFKGNQTVTGSLLTSGSNTLIGSTTLTGSFSVSGSTTQTGNNTLIGNTVLSGSIEVSGSQTFKGSMDLTGSLTITGSTVQIGNNKLTGNTSLTGSIAMTGSILIFGDILPQISSSYNLGSETQPWKSIYVQSGSINIQSDIPGGIPAVISNANGNVTITQAGFQLKSGSFVPFEVSSTARTIIRLPNIPANDIGGLSIIGSSDGTYQPVINPSGMLHITSNDNQAARVTVDGFGSNIGTIFVGRHARGTSLTPTSTLLGDVLVRFAGLGYATSSYFPVVGAVPTALEFQATENYSTSSYGSKAVFYTYANGAVSRSLAATIDTTGITIPSTSKFFGTASWANNAQTASYVNPLNQNVTITGSLLVSGSTTITGSLTLSSGSALRINNGFYVDGNRQFNYGQFSSTQTQSGSADTAYSMTFNTTDFSQGVSLVSGSRITIANTGLYNIQFSSQLHTTVNQSVDFSIWFAMTGSNIANSNTDFSIEKVTGGGFQVAALNFLTQIQSGSYVELKYSKTTAQGQLQAKGTQSTPTRPVTPSVILTVTQIA